MFQHGVRGFKGDNDRVQHTVNGHANSREASPYFISAFMKNEGRYFKDGEMQLISSRQCSTKLNISDSSLCIESG